MDFKPSTKPSAMKFLPTFQGQHQSFRPASVGGLRYPESDLQRSAVRHLVRQIVLFFPVFLNFEQLECVQCFVANNLPISDPHGNPISWG